MCELSKIADVTRCSNLSKQFLAILTQSGITYAMIASHCPDGSDEVDATAIKQFVYRNPERPRNTKTFRAIVNAIKTMIKSSEIKTLPSYPELKTIHDHLLNEINSNPGTIINQSQIGVMEKSQKISQNIYVARNYCFLRRYSGHDETNAAKKTRKFVRIFVNVWEYESYKFKFLMKINGIYGRRVVLGDVYETNSGLTMMGLSLPVNEFIGSKELISFPTEKILNNGDIIVPNPVGFELVNLPRVYLGDAFIPAAFFGVNGEGASIFGNGLYINLDTASKSGFFDAFIAADDADLADLLDQGEFEPLSSSLAFQSMETNRGFTV